VDAGYHKFETPPDMREASLEDDRYPSDESTTLRSGAPDTPLSNLSSSPKSPPLPTGAATLLPPEAAAAVATATRSNEVSVVCCFYSSLF
jgi:hypothetical protein